MPETNKICPLTNEYCDPSSSQPEKTMNNNCSFFYSDMFVTKCFYIEALKAIPNILESVKKIKNHV